MPALLAAIVALAVGVPTPPTRWVEDHAGLMSEPARAALDARLEAYEAATGHQVVVWIGTSHGDAPLADWSVRTFAAWKLGRAKLDDGVAIFVFSSDHAIDIEVGYGLEDRVPDAIASRIVHDVMIPRFRAGDNDGAIAAGADAVLAAIDGKAFVAPEAPSSGPSTLTWVLGAIGVLVVIVLFITHPRAMLFVMWALMRQGGRGGSNRSSGFGGGGGRSGGGGARGTW